MKRKFTAFCFVSDFHAARFIYFLAGFIRTSCKFEAMSENRCKAIASTIMFNLLLGSDETTYDIRKK